MQYVMKDLVEKHKKEKERILSKKYIFREKADSCKKLISNKLVKVITGPRRAGKSTLAFLLLKDKNFAYINFDDERLLRLKNMDDLMEDIFEVYGNPDFLLFDEIQNLKDWELVINRLHRNGHNILVTGSNAKLLSKELSTHLTGRHVPIDIFPFNFREFLLAKNSSFSKDELVLPEVKGKLLNLLDTYLIKGGFPEIVVENIEPDIYLNPLFDSVILKDIIKRYNIRFSQKLTEIARYLLSNFTSELSFNKLKNILSINSVHTIQNYLYYLEETFLFFMLERYSRKMKEQIKSPRKVYIVDNGYMDSLYPSFSPNTGKLMENLVYYELLKKGAKPNLDLFYYKTRNGKEVDFVIKDGIKIKSLIQACYELNIENQKREFSALIEASEELKCKDLKIITWDLEKKVKFKKKTISIIPLWKWLLQ